MTPDVLMISPLRASAVSSLLIELLLVFPKSDSRIFLMAATLTAFSFV